MNDGDRRTPISLAGNKPVAQTVVCFERGKSVAFELFDDRFSRFVAEKSVEFSAVYKVAVLNVRQNRVARFVCYNLIDGEIILFGESKISFVVRRNAHNRARAVTIKNVIGGVDRHFFARERVYCVRTRPDARFFTVGRKAFYFVCLARFENVLFHRFFLRVGSKLFYERMFGG